MSETLYENMPVVRDPEHPLELAPDLTAAGRAQAVTPLARQGSGEAMRTQWLVTGYAEVRELLASPSTTNSSTAWGLPPAPPGMLALLDPPDHTRIRRMLTQSFTVKRLEALRPQILDIVSGALDALEKAGPGVDLMHTFALPVPSLVICELLGVPYEDHADFQRRSDALLDFSASPQERGANMMEMNAYMGQLVARQRAEPRGGILARLIQEHGDEVTDDELVGIGNILLFAGHETTANTIGLGVLLLLQHPDQLALVRDDPSVIRTAVEEILRYLSPVHTGTPRVATVDFELGGQTIQRGDALTVLLPPANRDDAVVANPNVFDVTRTPGAAVSFGHGIHQCLGQQLARIELSVAFPALLRRFPGLRLATEESDLRFRTNSTVNGVRALPVAW